MNLAHLGGSYSEEGTRTSWVGPFLGVVALALAAAYVGGEIVLSPDASDTLRIQTAAGFGGAVLALGLVFLIYRSRQKP